MPNPDLEIRGGGGTGHPDPYISGAVPPKNFSALQASVWSKNRGTWAPWSPSLDPPLQELFPVIQLLFSLTLSIDTSLRQTMVAVLAACILDSWTKCIIACDHLEQATVVGS